MISPPGAWCASNIQLSSKMWIKQSIRSRVVRASPRYVSTDIEACLIQLQTLNPPKPDTPASVVLRPEDAMARPLQSISSPANNILLQVTAPKRTGRKRKKGSDEPFRDDPAAVSDGPPRPTARELLQILRDNAGRYQVEPVGLVERTHVFRGMSTLIYATC